MPTGYREEGWSHSTHSGESASLERDYMCAIGRGGFCEDADRRKASIINLDCVLPIDESLHDSITGLLRTTSFDIETL